MQIKCSFRPSSAIMRQAAMRILVTLSGKLRKASCQERWAGYQESSPLIEGNCSNEYGQLTAARDQTKTPMSQFRSVTQTPILVFGIHSS